MRMIHKKMKKGLAAFLAVCMVASSLQISGRSTALGAESEKEASVLEFDRAKLREAAYNAVSNTQMVQPPSVVATSSNAVGTGFDMTSFELTDAPSLLAEGVSMPADTGLRIFLTPQWQGFDDEDGTYHLTGDETLTFMIENEGGEEQGYQLLFGDKLTEIIHVESKKELLKEYKAIQDEEDEGTLVPGGGSGGGGGSASQPTQPGESAGTGESQAPQESGSIDETGSQPEESESAGETESQPEESGSTDETGSQVPEESGSTDEIGSQPEESGSTDETGSQPEETEAQPEEGGNTGDTGNQTPDEDKDSAGDTGNEAGDNTDTGSSTDTETEEDAADSDVSILGKAVDILTGTITAHAAELLPIATDSEADPLPEATPSEPEEDSEVSIATDSNAGKSQTSFVSSLDESEYTRLEPVHVSESTLIYKELKTVDLAEDAENISMAVFSLELEEEDTTPKASNTSAVAFYGVRVGDIVPLADVAGSLEDIEVSLYDYSESALYTENESDLNNKEYDLEINKYLKNTAKLNDKNENVFLFGGGQDRAVINRYWSNDSYDQAQNIYQGIPDMLGREKLFDALFPETQVMILQKAIKVYSDVGVNDFFALENGRYSYNSDEDGAKYNSKTKSLDKIDENDGFWPFGTNNWYFGMKMQFDFYKPKNGQYMNKDMEFSFSGDDDVWVYLTNKNTGASYLVLDIGGNHGRMDGSINFADGTISYTNENAKELREKGPVIHNAGDIYEKKPVGGATTYTTTITKLIGSKDKNFFTNDPAEYTLEFYYLERGGYASNCKLDFNLPVIPKHGIQLAKQLSGKLTDKEYQESYSFNVVTSNDLEALNFYRTSGDRTDGIEIQPYEILGAGTVTAEELIAEDEYFYIEEVLYNSDSTPSWNISTSGEGQNGATAYNQSGTRTEADDWKYYYSPIYQMNEDIGFLFTCTNTFGELDPQVAKRAWKDWSKGDAGEYDITLEVTGDEMETTIPSEQGQPVNVVVAMDKSSSIRESDFKAMKTAIIDMAKELAEGSQMSVIAFSGDEEKDNFKEGGYCSYDDPRSTGYYTDVTEGWREVGGGSANEVEARLNSLKKDSNTHSAAGFLGSRHKLSDVPNSNPEVVIYMTDGEPYQYVKETKNGKFSYVSDQDEAKKAAINELKKLAETHPDASIYTIGYDVGSKGEWLKTSEYVTKYYPADNIDELKEQLGEIISEITIKTKVTDPVVTDVLSDSVKVPDSGLELWLKDGKVDGTDENGTQTVTDKGIQLSASTSGNITTYTYPDGETVIAEYDSSARKITWFAGRTETSGDLNQLGNATRTLTYRVEAVKSTADEETGDPDTGTHEDEKGYHSNVYADLTYQGGSKDFPHPVVVPGVKKAGLTITKEVAGIEPEDNAGGTYDFTITFGSDFGYDSYTPPAEAARTADGYTFELQADGSITFPDLPEGTSYTVAETGWKLTGDNADEYVLTQIEAVSDSTTESTTNKRPETLEFEGTIPENNSTVTFTNTFSKYGCITIEKKVEGTAPSNTFGFSITGGEESTLSKDYESVQVLAGGSTAVQIEPEDLDKTFVITETDTQGAWSTTVQKNGDQSVEAVSVNAKNGDTVTFTNRYYAHQLTLKKTVDNSPNPYPDADYGFTITLNLENGQSLTDEEKQAVKLDSKDAAINTDNQITTSLKADGSISLTGLPQKVTSVTITENLTQPADGAHSLALQAVWKAGGGMDNMLQPENNAVTIALPPKADCNETITFQNKYTPENGTLTITKQIVDESGAGIAIEENRTFTFKVEQLDESSNVKMTFYKTIQVSKGASSADTGAFTVPAGTYRITEIPTLKYKCSSENPQTVTIAGGGTGEAAFQNYKTTDSYFTDVSCVVNKVVSDGNGSYEYQPSSTSPSLADRMGWVPSKSKQEDET